MIRVTVSPSLADLSARYSRAAEYVPQLIGYALGQAGEAAKEAFQSAAPVGTGKTEGHLASSFFSRPQSELVVLVGSNQPLKLTWVTEGTASPILPLVARALWSPELPHPMAWVHGQAANDFIAPILGDARQFLDDQIPDLLHYLAVLLAGGSVPA